MMSLPSASKVISPEKSRLRVVPSWVWDPVVVSTELPAISASRLLEILRSRIPVTSTTLVAPNVKLKRATESSRKLMFAPPASRLISPTALTLKFAPTLNWISVPLACAVLINSRVWVSPCSALPVGYNISPAEASKTLSISLIAMTTSLSP